MDFSRYFTSIPNSSLTFDNATIRLDQNGFSSKISTIDIENEASDGKFLKDLVFKADAGEMVLVLGKPASLFFDALFIDHKCLNYFPKGSIRFKNNDYKKFSMKCPHNIIYSDEDDIHFPTLTVRQTIDFALDCKFNLSKTERVELRNCLLKELGLSNVADTLVGNEYIRGISGGERKRISILETFIANGSIYLWDNSTKGLDSSTALDFLVTLQKLARATKTINFVKISQASDKIVEKFDKILMLSDSRQIFYGTVNECLEHFTNSLGILRDPNLCVIEFLTTILNSPSKSISNDFKTPVHNPSAVSSLDSEDYLYQRWRSSPNYLHWKKTASVATEEPCDHLSPEDITPIFSTTKVKALQCCTKRAFQRLFGDRSFIFAQISSTIVEALVTGSLFYQIPLTTLGSFSRGSLTFFSVLFFTFLSLADIPMIFERQKVVDKQVKLYFYPQWIEALGTTIYDYIFKLIIVILFTIILYFLAHFQFNGARFFIFLLFLGILNFTMVSTFALVAFLTPTIAVANSVAGIILLAIAMYASYVIYIQDMRPWFVWIAYLNPAMFTMEAILSNELFNLKLDCTETIVPRGEAYSNMTFSHKTCAWQGATLGNSFVWGKDYLKQTLNYSYSHVWRNFGILMGFLVFLLTSSLVAAQYITPLFNRKRTHHLSSKLQKISLIGGLSKKRHHQGYASQLGENEEFHSSNSSIEYISEQKCFSALTKNCETEIKTDTQKHVFSWKNVSYTINGLKLIDDSSGFVFSGMTALMGESGAGKTTLLNIISRMAKEGHISGEFFIDGAPLVDIKAFGRSIGFVQQQDIHLDLLTVYESLEVSCILRGDGDKSYIDTISTLLDLNPHQLVKNLSPTEKKLLSIGVELVTKPSLLLLLDEPTSGLDSHAALIVIKFLKKLSTQGQAIFCTIHQPSRSIFSHFDHILLLKSGGKCAYFGSAQSAPDYFLKYDKSLTYDEKVENPAEFIIQVVGHSKDDTDGNKADEIVIDWPQVWLDSVEHQAFLEKMISMEDYAANSAGDFTKSLWKEASYTSQLLLITKRQFLCVKRDKSYILAKFLLNAGAGLFVGFSFWNTKYNITGLKNATFLCFMSLCISSALINQVQDKAIESKNVYLAREASTKTYRWSVFLFAQLIVEIPLAISSSTLFFLCCYFCCGYSFEAHIAGVYYLNYILFSVYYLTFGLWLIYSTPNLQTAAVIVAFLYSFTAEFCGVMQPYTLMPKFWRFMYRVSPYTYFVETFVSLLLHERPVDCKPMELVPTLPPLGQTCGQFMQPFVDEHGGKVVNPNSTSICAYCTYSIGDEFLKDQSMSYNHIWRNFGIECAYVVFNVVAMCSGFYLIYIKTGWMTIISRFFKCVRSRIRYRRRLD